MAKQRVSLDGKIPISIFKKITERLKRQGLDTEERRERLSLSDMDLLRGFQGYFQEFTRLLDIAGCTDRRKKRDLYYACGISFKPKNTPSHNEL